MDDELEAALEASCDFRFLLVSAFELAWRQETNGERRIKIVAIRGMLQSFLKSGRTAFRSGVSGADEEDAEVEEEEVEEEDEDEEDACPSSARSLGSGPRGESNRFASGVVQR